MMQRKPTLGRGLADLLGARQMTPPPGSSATPAGDELTRLPLDLLQRGKYQPRLDMRPETLSELAQSIKAQGVMQPIVVRPLPERAAGGSQRYEIIAGERRWRAAQMAGLAEIPAIVREVARQGYAIVDQELEEGLRAVAAPIHGAADVGTAAINVSAHASRVSMAAMRAQIVPALLDTARQIEADLRAQSVSP